MEAYQKYVESISTYSTPLSFEAWCHQVTNEVFDIMAGC